MASDSPGDASVSVSLPESLGRWLDDKASEEGRSREDVLLQLLSAYRKVDGLEDGAVDLPEGMEPDEGLPAALEAEIEERVDARVEERLDESLDGRFEEVLDDRLDGELDERLGDHDDAVAPDQLNQRVSAVESRFMDLLEDVRERVIQVKRETDAKAPADHEHEALADAVEALSADVEAASSTAEGLEARMESGFENYEEVLAYLADSIDGLSGRQTTLGRALVETREELRKLAARDTARSAAEALKREANQYGVGTADCGDCGGDVDVGLLTRAECPHCSAPFVAVEPAQGFFGSDTLAVGERPALEAAEGAGDGFEHDVDDIVDGEESASRDVADELGDEEGGDDEGADG